MTNGNYRFVLVKCEYGEETEIIAAIHSLGLNTVVQVTNSEGKLINYYKEENTKSVDYWLKEQTYKDNKNTTESRTAYKMYKLWFFDNKIGLLANYNTFSQILVELGYLRVGTEKQWNFSVR